MDHSENFSCCSTVLGQQWFFKSNLKDLEFFDLDAMYFSFIFPELDAYCQLSLWKTHFWLYDKCCGRKTTAASLASFISLFVKQRCSLLIICHWQYPA